MQSLLKEQARGDGGAGPLQELAYWYRLGNDAYVQRVEAALARALLPPVNTTGASSLGLRVTGGMTARSADADDMDGTLAPHLFSALVATDAGAALVHSTVRHRPQGRGTAATKPLITWLTYVRACVCACVRACVCVYGRTP
jgi:hypothetical protein